MAQRGRPPHPDILTPRQWEVLALIREGYTDQQIAARLGISLDGAKYHVSEILARLGVGSREEAAKFKIREQDTGVGVLAILGRIAAIGFVAGVVAAIALLAFGVASTMDGETEADGDVPGVTCESGEPCPGFSMWEPTGEFQSADRQFTLTVHWLTLKGEEAEILTTVTPHQASTQIIAGIWRLRDDQGNEYELLGTSWKWGEQCINGVAAQALRFRRPPDRLQTLILELEATGGSYAYCVDPEETMPLKTDTRLAVAFATNVDDSHPSGYIEVGRIAPEPATAGGAVLESPQSDSIRVTKNGKSEELSP